MAKVGSIGNAKVDAVTPGVPFFFFDRGALGQNQGSNGRLDLMVKDSKGGMGLRRLRVLTPPSGRVKVQASGNLGDKPLAGERTPKCGVRALHTAVKTKDYVFTGLKRAKGE